MGLHRSLCHVRTQQEACGLEEGPYVSVPASWSQTSSFQNRELFKALFNTFGVLSQPPEQIEANPNPGCDAVKRWSFFKRQLGLDEVVRMGPHDGIRAGAFIRRERPELSFPAM